MSSTAQSDADLLAQERDAKFKKWLQNKAVKEKAFEYLTKLDSERAMDEKSLIEVGVALCGVDRLCGVDDSLAGKKSNQSEDGYGDLLNQMKGNLAKKPTVETASSKKTMKSAWMKWAMEYYSFSMLILTKADVASLSDAVQEFLFSEADLVASSGAGSEEIDKADKEKNILPSLKYFFPAVPKPNEKPRPLTSDQKAQNTIYMRELRKLWLKAREELDSVLIEYVAKGLKSQRSAQERAEKESKEQGYYEGNNREKMSRILENNCLHELSLKKLRNWIEEDEDKKLTKENEDALEKLKLAKTSHEQFVKKKDSLRIRMPDNIPPAQPPAMTYGREVSAIKPEKAGPRTTVELMAGTGLKYVHATNKGRTGMEGDLEKSRQKLLKLGYVNRENFEEEDAERYHKEKKENTVLVEKQMMEKKVKEESAKAYEEWIKVKDMRDQAVKCLNLIPKPSIGQDTDFKRRSTASLESLRSSTNANRLLLDHREVFDHIVDVGKSLKCVDRTLFMEWSKWCDSVLNTNICSILWDYFEPRACDVHSISYSQIRDTFLKLLRPGVDYKDIFIEHVEKTIFRRKVENFKTEKGYHRLEPEEQMDMDREIDSLKKEWLASVHISKASLTMLLRQIGIVLKEGEMRSLVDSFDSNGDGVVTLQEFLEFIGPKREKRSGNTAVLNRRCCWMTTCKLTGMPNGYSVSGMSKRYQRQIEEEKRGKERAEKEREEKRRGAEVYEEEYERDGEGEEEEYKVNENFTGKVVLKQLANGESRMCIELTERRKREDILRRYGLLDEDEEKRGKKRGEREKKGRDDEDYEEEYEDDYDEEGEERGRDKHKGTLEKRGSKEGSVVAVEPCSYSSWSFSDRKAGLKYLLSITKDAREEEQLKDLLSKGSAPSAPKLFSSMERKIQTKSTNRYKSITENDEEEENQVEGEDSSTSLTIYWGPQASTDLVSFYSLEYGGPAHSNNIAIDPAAQYKEIFRDPVEAGLVSEFHFQYTMRGLEAGVTYNFRIRAFNGFGPSDYTYKKFTTSPDTPLTPKIINITPGSVTLRWTFTENFFQRLEELKTLFNVADKDKSGKVSREELAASLDDKASSTSKLRHFLEKIASTRGISLENGYGALFDMIEGDDDGGLSWAEFEAFFLATGWTNTQLVEKSTTHMTSRLSLTSSVNTHSKTSSGTSKVKEITYLVEKCENEFDNIYTEALRTTSGQATITRLEPGQSYRFRIRAMNVHEVPGPPSTSVTVHTLLETPAPPVAKNIKANSFTVQWKARNTVTNSRTEKFIEKMVGDWTHSDSLKEQGVSIEAAFAKYDVNHSGDIDAGELVAVLKDLGVEPSEERLAQAFAMLDTNGDGVVSYEEFAVWWKREEVTYVLSRSDPLPFRYLTNRAPSYMETTRAKTLSRGRFAGMQLQTIEEEVGGQSMTRSLSRSRPLSAARLSSTTASGNKATPKDSAPVLQERSVGMACVVYRDNKTRFEVQGLLPNNYYHFRVRYVGSRSNSMLSPPLTVMTAPLSIDKAVLIDLTSNTIRIKWYGPLGGCFKFLVMLRCVGCTAALRKLPGPIIGVDTQDQGWFIVYNGQDNFFTCTTLTPEMKYELKVFAVNYLGTMSEASTVLEFSTPSRDENDYKLASKNAGKVFTIECTKDICVGDSIILTERLFLRPKAGDKEGSVVKGEKSVRESMKSLKSARSTMQQSVTSLTNQDGATITAVKGDYIGERTIAGYVVRDNYRTIRENLSSGNEGRRVWLEVIWTKNSSDACKPYEIKAGDVVERLVDHIEKFEVFRCSWKQESLRKPLLDEWKALQDCFIPVD